MVAALGMKNSDGTYVGFWGAMSDESRSFRPWTHQFTRGLYLAGVETYADAVAPEGWTKWVGSENKRLFRNHRHRAGHPPVNHKIGHILIARVRKKLPIGLQIILPLKVCSRHFKQTNRHPIHTRRRVDIGRHDYFAARLTYTLQLLQCGAGVVQQMYHISRNDLVKSVIAAFQMRHIRAPYSDIVTGTAVSCRLPQHPHGKVRCYEFPAFRGDDSADRARPAGTL